MKKGILFIVMLKKLWADKAVLFPNLLVSIIGYDTMLPNMLAPL